MGLGIEQRVSLLSEWIVDRAKTNGILCPCVTIGWDSATRRWLVRLMDEVVLETLEQVTAGGLMNAMRSLWMVVQERWPT